MWAVDIYSGPLFDYSGLDSMEYDFAVLATEMGSRVGNPLILGETWFNDDRVSSQLSNILSRNGHVNLYSIFQWQWRYDDYGNNNEDPLSQSAIMSLDSILQINKYSIFK